MSGPASSLGPALVGLGLLIALLGVLIWTGALGWVGRLPGDLRFGGDSFRIHLPLGSMLVVSVVLTLLVSLLRRFF